MLALLVLAAFVANRWRQASRDAYPARLRPVWTAELPGTETWAKTLVGDVNGDGTDELVYALSAVGTTNRIGDTDDDHAYVGVLDLAGRLQRQWAVGGKSNWVDIALGVLDGSGKQRIVAGVSLNERTEVRGPRPGVGRVLCFDERGTNLARFELDAELVDLRLGDVDGDRRSEVVTTDRLGQVYVIASDFQHHHKRLVTTNAFSFVWKPQDDGPPTIVVLAGRAVGLSYRRW